MTPKNLPFKLLIFSLIFSVLAFGMRAIWSRFVVETLLFLAMGLVLVEGIRREREVYRVPGFAPLGLFLGWMAIQVIPLPMGWVAWLSPETARLYRETDLITGGLGWATLSINPDLSLVELFRFASAGIAYLLAVQLLAHRDRFRRAVAVVAIFGGGLALFSVVQHVISGGLIYWFRKLAGFHFGPFVYRNHYAGFMVLVFPVAFALFYAHKPEIRYTSFRENLVDMLTGRESNLHLLYGLAALMVATSVFVSLSRGGVISLCVSMLLLSLVLQVQQGRSKKGLLILMFVTLIVLSVSWFGWDALMERFAKSFSEDGELQNARFTYWEDTVRIIGDFGWVGSGFGTFASIFPAYQSLNVGGRLVSHAHNDYLELLSDGGWVGAFLVFAFVGMVLVSTLRAYGERRDRLSRVLTVGGLAGLFGFLIHSTCEFNFHNGANTLWFFFMMALLVSAANTHLRGSRLTSLVPVTSRAFLWLSLALVVGGLGACVYYNVTSLGAEVVYAEVRGAALSPATGDDDAQTIFEAVKKAEALNPLNARYSLAMASVRSFRNEPEVAQHFFARAARLDPASADLFHRFALQVPGLKRAVITQSLELARDREPLNPERYKFLAVSRFAEGDRFGGKAELTRAMALSPDKKNIVDCLRLLIYHGVSESDIAESLPPSAPVFLVAADFFGDYRRDAIAESMADRAYTLAVSGEKQDIGVYFRLCDRLVKRKELERALSVLKQASASHPDNVSVFIRCGDIYTKMGIGFRARDEYRKALALRPNDRTLQARVSKAGKMM